MVVADPFGSWVTGRREGQQDAIAQREAQDRTAQNAFGLQNASVAAPYQMAELRNATDTSNIQNDVLHHSFDNNNLYNTADANALEAQVRPATALANYGIGAPLDQVGLNATPGSSVGPGGISGVLKGANGTQTNLNTPFGNIQAPQQVHQYYYGLMQQMRQQHYQQLEEAAQQRIALQQQLAAAKLSNQQPAQAAPTGTGAFSGMSTTPTKAQAPAGTVSAQQAYNLSYQVPTNSFAPQLPYQDNSQDGAQ